MTCPHKGDLRSQQRRKGIWLIVSDCSHPKHQATPYCVDTNEHKQAMNGSQAHSCESCEFRPTPIELISNDGITWVRVDGQPLAEYPPFDPTEVGERTTIL